MVGLMRGFMLAVFGINLDRRLDRWAATSGNLGALGVVPGRIGASPLLLGALRGHRSAS